MKPSKYFLTMLTMLSLLSFLRCKPGAAEVTIKTESDADRLTTCNQYLEALYPIRIKGKWGYINRKGETIIPPSWDEADDFYGGMAKVGIISGTEMHYGFIDPKGQWMVQPIYQKAGAFKEGLAYVSKYDRFGYVDHYGKEVIHCQFEDAADFHNGYAAIKQGGWTGFIDTIGHIVVKPQYTVSVSHPRFNEGLAPVFGADEKTGFVDTAGQWVIEPLFHSAGNFSEGKAWAMIQEDDDQAEHGFTIKGGFIGTDGQFLIEPRYDFGWDFTGGHATVWGISEDRKRKIWKVIDGQGAIVLDSLPYRNVGSLQYGLIPVQDEELKWGFINIWGEVVIPPQFSGINHFQNGMARMEAGTAFENAIVYINPKGEVVWSEK